MAAKAESSLVASSESPFNVKGCVKLFHLMVVCVQHLSSLTVDLNKRNIRHTEGDDEHIL